MTSLFTLPVIALLFALAVALTYLIGPGNLRPLGRFLVGAPLSGERLTDASFWHPGTRTLHHAQPLGSWSWRPGWYRALVRDGTVVALVAFAWGWAHSPGVTVTLSGSAAWCVLCWRLRVAVLAYRDREHTRLYVKPLHAVLAAQLDLEPTRRPESYLVVPHTFDQDENTPVRVTLPAKLPITGAMKSALTETVLGKLGFSGQTADVEFSAKGGESVMTVRMAPQPPARVLFADIRAEFAANKPGEVVLGLDSRSKVYRGNFNGDDPHWGFSCGSRRGKSTMLMCTAAQLAAADLDMVATFIDVKRTSFAALLGVPGFTFANNPRDIPAMWDAIKAFRVEMDRRMDVTDLDATAEFPMAVLFIDEVNQFSAMSRSVWRRLKGKGDPATPPVWEDVAAVAWQGAQFRCHLVVAGQRLDDTAFGGNGLRDSLGFRGLAGFRPQQWAMLIGTFPVPRSRKERGRWIYDDGEGSKWVQNIWGTPIEVRDYVMAARRPITASDVPGQGAGVDTRPDARGVPGTSGESGTDGRQIVIGLEPAAAWVGMNLEAFKKMRQRAGGSLPGEFREGARPCWWAADLDALKADQDALR